MLYKEFQILLTAFMFYTRINLGKRVNYKAEYAKACTKYLPFIGWVVGGFSAGVYVISATVFSSITAIILSILSTILLTGGFHEDGLADTCDGFGGGWTKEKILHIMKDSTIGTYGALGLIFLLGLKVSLLYELYVQTSLTPLVLMTIIAHTLSRFMATMFLVTHDYSGSAEQSKSKDMIQKTPYSFLILPGVLTLIPLGLLAIYQDSFTIVLFILPALCFKMLLGRYFKKWIDGYTGDCLGATQQITEVVIYLTSVVLWPYI